MSFQTNIQKWVSIDNELKRLNDKIKDLRNEKNNVATDIYSYVHSQNLNDSTIKISDGNIKFNTVKQYSPLSIKHVENCLNKCISNKESCQRIINYIKENRDVKYLNDIKRYYTKVK